MNQIIMILLISILVLVHELGHYFAARMCGVRVTRFGIGMPFGPSIKLFKIGYTKFYLHAFLFGGYVMFADDVMLENKEGKSSQIDEDEILPKDSPELFENKPKKQKFFILSAGVFMNLIFGIFLVMFAASIYHKLPAQSQSVYVDGFSAETTSNIKKYKINKGDKFLKANGNDINTLYSLLFYTKNSKMFDDYASKDLIEKNTQALIKLNPKYADAIKNNEKIKPNAIIYLPKMMSEKPLDINKDVLEGLQKYKKEGIKLNQNQIALRDEIISRMPIRADKEIAFKDLIYALSDTYKPLSITFLDKENKSYTINNIKIGNLGILGITLDVKENFVETKTLKSTVINSFRYCYITTVAMLKGLMGLILGRVNASDMHGIIAVVKVGGDIIASKGMLNGLLLTAMISINLAIINFLPIPALDGGHVMFLIIEKVTGRKPTAEMAEKINNFFFILLIILMIAISYNDIFGLITKKF